MAINAIVQYHGGLLPETPYLLLTEAPTGLWFDGAIIV